MAAAAVSARAHEKHSTHPQTRNRYGDGMFDDAAYAWAGLNAAPVKAALRDGKGPFDR